MTRDKDRRQGQVTIPEYVVYIVEVILSATGEERHRMLRAVNDGLQMALQMAERNANLSAAAGQVVEEASVVGHPALILASAQTFALDRTSKVYAQAAEVYASIIRQVEAGTPDDKPEGLPN